MSKGKSSQMATPENQDYSLVFGREFTPEQLSVRERILASAALYTYFLSVKGAEGLQAEKTLKGFQAVFNAVRSSVPSVPTSVPTPVQVDGVWDDVTKRVALSVLLSVLGADTIQEIAAAVQTQNLTPVQLASAAGPRLLAFLQTSQASAVKPLLLVDAWRALLASGAGAGDLAAEVLVRSRSGTGDGWVLSGDPMLAKVPPQEAQAAVRDVQSASRNTAALAPDAAWQTYALFGGAGVLGFFVLYRLLTRRG